MLAVYECQRIHLVKAINECDNNKKNESMNKNNNKSIISDLKVDMSFGNPYNNNNSTT